MTEIEQLRRENLTLKMELAKVQSILLQRQYDEAAAALKAMDEAAEPVPLRAVGETP